LDKIIQSIQETILGKSTPMSNSINRHDLVRKYFTKSPIKPIEPDYSKTQSKINIGGGLLFLTIILLFSGQGGLVFLGIFSGYFGFRFLSYGLSTHAKLKKEYEDACDKYTKDYEDAEPKPTDKQMDEWMSNDIEKIKDEALRRLDLDHDDYQAEPLLIGGPASLKDTRFVRGKDGKIRYSYFNILVVFLTEYHVATYQSDNCMEYGQTLTDRTQEFPYREITNLGTNVLKETIHLLDDVIESESGIQEFTLETSGANVIKVRYKFDRTSEQELFKIGGESTITAIRKKLQEYKKKYEK
jgi:hypothetical protein